MRPSALRQATPGSAPETPLPITLDVYYKDWDGYFNDYAILYLTIALDANEI